MSKFSTALKLIKNNRAEFLFALVNNFRFILSDKIFFKLIFKCRMGYDLNLDNPKTFNEKLNWLKLYDRNPFYTTLVDKYAVKQYVSNKIGPQYIIPTLGVWNNFEEIDFNMLPNQFVLKCTHDSGGLVICKDKSFFDMADAKKKLTRSLKRNYYKSYGEWPYKDVPPRIIAEKYMEDENGELRDYKFFCFDGIVKSLFIATDRQKKDVATKFDFFDREFNHLPFTKGHPNSIIPPTKPSCFNEMIRLAEILSENIPHVRVDLYEIKGKVYFGEMTFYDNSGIVPFNPPIYDEIWGEWIRLPSKEGK